MWEQIYPRPGTDPSQNGGEWNILDRDTLQYACIFPLDTPVTCPNINDLGPTESVACECTYHGAAAYANPVCNGLEQTHAYAFPSIRQLQVLRDYGTNSVVASICARNTDDPTAADFGYRPFVAALVDRIGEQLQDKCLPRALSVIELEGGRGANCTIVEADPRTTSCNLAEARSGVNDAIASVVYERLRRTNGCQDVDGDCRDFNLCEIGPLEPGTADHQSCLTSDNPTGNGWCYVDPEQGLGDESQVARCPATEKRRIRFAGAAMPKKGALTFFACEAGSLGN
jgi:hypothetical protein